MTESYSLYFLFAELVMLLWFCPK